MNVRSVSKVDHVTSVTRGTRCRKESVFVSYDANSHTNTHTFMHHILSVLQALLIFVPACDDDCTGVLLDDLDRIHNHFLSVNLSDVVVVLYRQLVLLENQTKNIQVNCVRLPSAGVELTMFHIKPGDVFPTVCLHRWRLHRTSLSLCM